MKLAVSNIAWAPELEREALDVLREAGISGLEVAPTRAWPEWLGASQSAGEMLARHYAARGMSVPALQAILFGKPQYKLFGTDTERNNLMNHLQFCADLARAIGAKSLVFGAPKNRELHGMSQDVAFGIAQEFFSAVAPYYEGRGVCLCLEPNPPQYGCDFLTDSNHAGKLVRLVNLSGLRLHLDTACMYLAGEDLATALRNNFELLHHFHVSEPFLGSFDRPVIDHVIVAETLHTVGYGGWVSLEMREASEPLMNLRRAVEFLAQTYGEPE